jgi:hypothetical protein
MVALSSKLPRKRGSASRRTKPIASTWRALDEATFGSARTLNLRMLLPSAAEAADRAEQWLRQKQVERAGSVLVITGRGAQSPDGISVVRAAVVKRLTSLRRRGVVASWREHTPGSVIVELAPVGALFEQLPRRREPRRRVVLDPAGLNALAPATRSALRHLATRSLEALGVQDPSAFVEAEMLKQFAALAAALPAENRETALRSAIAQALDELDS